MQPKLITAVVRKVSGIRPDNVVRFTLSWMRYDLAASCLATLSA